VPNFYFTFPRFLDFNIFPFQDLLKSSSSSSSSSPSESWKMSFKVHKLKQTPGRRFDRISKQISETVEWTIVVGSTACSFLWSYASLQYFLRKCCDLDIITIISHLWQPCTLKITAEELLVLYYIVYNFYSNCKYSLPLSPLQKSYSYTVIGVYMSYINLKKRPGERETKELLLCNLHKL
jgi:hypothetical protein